MTWEVRRVHGKPEVLLADFGLAQGRSVNGSKQWETDPIGGETEAMETRTNGSRPLIRTGQAVSLRTVAKWVATPPAQAGGNRPCPRHRPHEGTYTACLASASRGE